MTRSQVFNARHKTCLLRYPYRLSSTEMIREPCYPLKPLGQYVTQHRPVAGASAPSPRLGPSQLRHDIPKPELSTQSFNNTGSGQEIKTLKLQLAKSVAAPLGQMNVGTPTVGGPPSITVSPTSKGISQPNSAMNTAHLSLQVWPIEGGQAPSFVTLPELNIQVPRHVMEDEGYDEESDSFSKGDD